ncbi:MAG: lipoprotein LpqH [Mycobacterium sp.]|nr:lipoprotein LpqH [Mycobacterium sp.]
MGVSAYKHACGPRFAGIVLALSGGLLGCEKAAPVVTLIEFDGERRSIEATAVTCTRQPGGGLVIVAHDGTKRSVRIQLTQLGQLVVQKAGLRYEELSGYVANPSEVTATKVDDTFTFSGRMPPNSGESQWHVFRIETTCPGYRDAPPADVGVRIGAP